MSAQFFAVRFPVPLCHLSRRSPSFSFGTAGERFFIHQRHPQSPPKDINPSFHDLAEIATMFTALIAIQEVRCVDNLKTGDDDCFSESPSEILICGIPPLKAN
jgi:hypothetical protein